MATHRFPMGVPGRGVAFDLGMWFVPLIAITAAAALAAVSSNVGLVAVLLPLTGAALFMAVGPMGNVRSALTLGAGRGSSP